MVLLTIYTVNDKIRSEKFFPKFHSQQILFREVKTNFLNTQNHAK